MLHISTLKKRDEFVALSKKGQHIVAKGLILQALPIIGEENGIKLGFTITKKVSKKAVERNRIKRRLREVAREVMQDFAKRGYIKTNYDYVIVGRRAALDRPFADLLKDFKYALHQVGKQES